MVDDLAAQWVLTAVFALATAFYLHRSARGDERPRGFRMVLDDALHALMGVAMVAMLWPWGMTVPVMLSVVVFTAAALWFVARALFIPSTAAVGRRGSPGLAWYHAGMMGSMVFMAVAMSVGMAAPAVTSASPAMPGMAMAGMDMGAGDTSGLAATVPPVPWLQVPSLVLAAGFSVAAVRLAAAGLRRRGRQPVLAGAAGGLMAAGMAVVFLLMA